MSIPNISNHDKLIVNGIDDTLENAVYNPLFGGRIVTFDRKNCKFIVEENCFSRKDLSLKFKFSSFFKYLGKLFRDICNFPKSLKILNFRNIDSSKTLEHINKILAGIKCDKLVKELNQITKELEEAPEDASANLLIKALEAKIAEVNLANKEYEEL